MVLDPFAKEGAGHLNFEGASITAQPQPHPLAKPEPKPGFTQPLGDRCAQGRLQSPRINRPKRFPVVRMFMLRLPWMSRHDPVPRALVPVGIHSRCCWALVLDGWSGTSGKADRAEDPGESRSMAVRGLTTPERYQLATNLCALRGVLSKREDGQKTGKAI
jgi:hypothetical protein